MNTRLTNTLTTEDWINATKGITLAAFLELDYTKLRLEGENEEITKADFEGTLKKVSRRFRSSEPSPRE